MSVLVFLAVLWYSNEFYIDLKAISCRIEWSLFQVRSPKHARDFYNDHYHKAAIVALRPQRINWDQTGINYVPASNWTMEQKG